MRILSFEKSPSNGICLEKPINSRNFVVVLVIKVFDFL